MTRDPATGVAAKYSDRQLARAVECRTALAAARAGTAVTLRYRIICQLGRPIPWLVVVSLLAGHMTW